MADYDSLRLIIVNIQEQVRTTLLSPHTREFAKNSDLLLKMLRRAYANEADEPDYVRRDLTESIERFVAKFRGRPDSEAATKFSFSALRDLHSKLNLTLETIDDYERVDPHERSLPSWQLRPHETTTAIYIDTNDPQVAREIVAAARDAMEYLGYSEQQGYEEQLGSLFATWWSKVRAGLTSSEFKQRLALAEHAIELHLSKDKQADVDVKEAEAFGKLVDKLEGVSNACLRLGSILVIKYTNGDEVVMLSRNLSEHELRILERYPEIQKEPSKVLDQIAWLLSEPKNTSGEITST